MPDVDYIFVNALTILFSACAGLIVGLSYRALLFRKGDRVSGSFVGLIITAFIAEYWLAAILAGALIVAPQQANPWVMAIASAVVIWAGFLVPVLIVTYMFRGLSKSAMALDCGHWCVVMIVQAGVLQAVGLIHPHM